MKGLIIFSGWLLILGATTAIASIVAGVSPIAVVAFAGKWGIAGLAILAALGGGIYLIEENARIALDFDRRREAKKHIREAEAREREKKEAEIDKLLKAEGAL